ncbi:MAG: histidine kinase dimerization/phospho-acceptor domain-containing protein, partial [Myxococcota bacterium]
MSRWYAPSLLPILVLAASLAVLVTWRDRRQWPIAAYCGSLAAWSAAIWLAAAPATEPLGDRAMMVGFFVPATFLHVAARDLGWDRRVVGAVYATGVAMTLTGAVVPNLYLSDGGTRPGPLFVPMFAATVAVGGVPLFLLWRGVEAPARRERRRYLRLAGAAMAAGGAVQVGSMLAHAFYPLGLYLLSVSVSLMTYVAQADPLPAFGRFVERTQRYALLAATLSAVWMLGLVGVVQLGGGWTWEAAPLLFVLTLTAQPLLTEARIGLAARVFPGGGDADGLTRALVDSEARAEHALRLAEIGTMASAVAHEVRNPLGVITACAAVLERQGADAEVLAEIRDQVGRAARFADELLEYGRPSPPR